MSTENLTENLAEIALAQAKKSGADAADVVVIESTDISTSCRLSVFENLERSESYGLGLRVWVGQRQAITSSSDSSVESIRAMAERAVAMAKIATEDPYSQLAPATIWSKNNLELDVLDDNEPSVNWLQEQALMAEDAARSIEGITNSEGADASYGKSRMTLATSAGFLGSRAASLASLSVSVLAGSGDNMQRDYDYATTRHLSDLPAAIEIGKKAAENTLKRLNPRKVPTCQVPVIFDPRVSKNLLNSLAGAISGASIARKTSFLKDALGTQIFAEHINIIDDPLIPRGLASRNFDSEGVGAQKRFFIKDGILQSWILDTRTAAQLGLQSTGHAARGLASPPSPSTSNFYMQAGKLTPQELISQIKSGFYVTECFGMGVNLITGDYSQGAAGFWIENGEIAYPVAEITIASRLQDMFSRLTPANDLVFRYSTNAPTLQVDGMTIAGS